MRRRYFTKTFGRFFAAFVCIVAVAFGVMLVASSQIPKSPVVDILAQPK